MTQPTEKPERNAAIYAAYLTGKSMRVIAEEHGVCRSRVGQIVQIAQMPTIRETRIPARAGRRAVWPDCPEHLRVEYNTLRTIVGGRAEARRQIEAAVAKAVGA